MDLNRIASLTSTVIRLVNSATDTYLTITGTAQNCKVTIYLITCWKNCVENVCFVCFSMHQKKLRE